MPTTVTKSQLRQLIQKVVREQVDMRSKEGRDLKDLAAQLIRQQKDLEAYTQSIQAVLSRQKELRNLAAASEQALFGRMQQLDMKTLEITEAVFRIEDEAKYKRVEPGYKPLYEKAIQELARFSSEQVGLIETMKETEINLKKAERVATMSVTKKPPLVRGEAKTQKASSQLNEQTMAKIAGWLKNVWTTLSKSFSRALSTADSALATLNQLA